MEMNMLKKIQRDLHKQKDYMNNMHVLQANMNEKLSCMEGKLDQQQSYIARLEEQVRNNNTPENNNFQNKIFSDESGIGDMEIDETYFPKNTYDGNAVENDNYVVTDELIKLLSRVLIKNIRVIDNVKIKFKEMESELTQIKALISKKIMAFEETAIAVQNRETCMMLVGSHRISQLEDELKLMMSEISEIKEEIKEIGEQCKNTDEPSTTCTEVDTIKIPSYSPAEQICDQINCELKRVTENCKATNMLPNIEIILDPNTEDHPIMKALQQGIFCVRHVPGVLCVNPADENNICGQHYTTRTIYLDTPGLKKNKVMKLLRAKPNMTLYELLKKGLDNTDLWHRLKNCNFYIPACSPPTWTCNNI